MSQLTSAELESIFESAARIERLLPDHDRQRLMCRAKWPDYLYDLDDRKDQEPEEIRLRVTASQLQVLETAIYMLQLLGTRPEKRITLGKKIVWARANNFSYQQIALVAGVSPSTCERWYKSDISKILRKINT